MQTVCNPIPTSINGYTCNPENQTKWNASVTAYCSGFDYGNEDESFTYYAQPVSNSTVQYSSEFLIRYVLPLYSTVPAPCLWHCTVLLGNA